MNLSDSAVMLPSSDRFYTTALIPTATFFRPGTCCFQVICLNNKIAFWLEIDFVLVILPLHGALDAWVGDLVKVRVFRALCAPIIELDVENYH